MPTNFDFSANKEIVEKQYNLKKGEYFKVKEGMNKVRLVSQCLPHESLYKGQKTFKWLCQVIDRVDGKIKPYFMPHSVYCMITDLQLSDDYRFSEVPMHYDISIGAQGAGTKEVKYSVTPARLNVSITDVELAAIKEAPTVQEVQAKIRENEKEEIPPVAPMTPEEEKLADSVPF